MANSIISVDLWIHLEMKFNEIVTRWMKIHFVITTEYNCLSSRLYGILTIHIVQFYLEITAPLLYTEYKQQFIQVLHFARAKRD